MSVEVTRVGSERVPKSSWLLLFHSSLGPFISHSLLITSLSHNPNDFPKTHHSPHRLRPHWSPPRPLHPTLPNLYPPLPHRPRPPRPHNCLLPLHPTLPLHLRTSLLLYPSTRRCPYLHPKRYTRLFIPRTHCRWDSGSGRKARGDKYRRREETGQRSERERG
jgi:hypothetical protein